MLSHACPDAVASWVDHGLEMTGRVDPVVDSTLGGIGCAGEHGEVGPETIGVAGVDSGLALLRGVVPSVAPIGAGLGGIHQGFVDRQFWDPFGLAGLVDEPDYLLSYLQIVRQAGAVPDSGSFWCGGGYGADRQRHAPALPSAVGGGDFYAPLRLGDSHPEGQYLLHCYRVWVAGGDGVVRTAGTDDEAASLSHLQGTALVATYPDRFGWRRYRCGGDGEGSCEDGCRQYGGSAFFRADHLIFLLISAFCGAFATNTISKQELKVDRDKRRNTETKSMQTTQRLVVHVEGLFRCDNLSDHITSHRQTWNTRKHQLQRVSESK